MNVRTTPGEWLNAGLWGLAGMVIMWPLSRIWPLSTSATFVYWVGWIGAPLLLAYAWHRTRLLHRYTQEAHQALLDELHVCRQAEQRLAMLQSFYQTILEDIPEMICRWQPDGRISYVNEAYCRYFGVSAEDIKRQGSLAHFRPASGSSNEPELALYREQPVTVVEFQVQQPDGSVRWQRWLDKALFDEAGNLCEFQSIGEDITARKLAEEASARLLEEKKRLARMALAIQEQERSHLARELHDELGQSLTAIRAEAQCVLHLNRERSATIAECAGSIERVAGQVYQVVHRMMHRLRPVLLDDLGLVEALNELLHGWIGRHPEVVLNASLPERLPRLDSERELTLYRVVQEALTNVARHAHASKLEVVMQVYDDRIRLTIRDNGIGFASTSREQGYGLLGMRERCLAVAGELTVSSQPGTGTTLQVVLPLHQEEVHQNGHD